MKGSLRASEPEYCERLREAFGEGEPPVAVKTKQTNKVRGIREKNHLAG